MSDLTDQASPMVAIPASPPLPQSANCRKNHDGQATTDADARLDELAQQTSPAITEEEHRARLAAMWWLPKREKTAAAAAEAHNEWFVTKEAEARDKVLNAEARRMFNELVEEAIAAAEDETLDRTIRDAADREAWLQQKRLCLQKEQKAKADEQRAAELAAATNAAKAASRKNPAAYSDWIRMKKELRNDAKLLETAKRIGNQSREKQRREAAEMAYSEWLRKRRPTE